jgi:hypothetical protein
MPTTEKSSLFDIIATGLWRLNTNPNPSPLAMNPKISRMSVFLLQQMLQMLQSAVISITYRLLWVL